MRILLDENMPESLRRALGELGHEVDSVASLRLKGLDNGRLYRDVLGAAAVEAREIRRETAADGAAHEDRTVVQSRCASSRRRCQSRTQQQR